jgi:energy-coupling factor transport system substrate-specific component
MLALIAALSAANAGLRMALAGGPYSVKPTAFLVIVGGIIAGPIPGLIIGWLSMTISDLAMSAGFWTIEESVGMGTVGLLAGLLWHRSKNVSRFRLTIGGLFLTVFYDLFTAIVDSVVYSYPLIVSLMGLYVPFLAPALFPSPYPFGLVHEITTTLLCASIGPSLINQIRKFYR